MDHLRVRRLCPGKAAESLTVATSPHRLAPICLLLVNVVYTGAYAGMRHAS